VGGAEEGVIEQRQRDLENFSSQRRTYVNIPRQKALGQGLNGPKIPGFLSPYFSIVGGRNPRGII